MAAPQDDAVLHFNYQNNVEIQFIKEDFLLVSITEQVKTLRILVKSQNRKITLTIKWKSDEGRSREITCRADTNINEEPGINVSIRNCKSCFDFLELFFTQEVLQLLVNRTNFYVEQERASRKLCMKSSHRK